MEGVNAFGEMDIYDAIIVDAQSYAEGIQSDFEPAVEVPSEGCGEIEFQEQGKIAFL